MAQNYHRAKLRGKSFKGQDLTGADFSSSDIRGTDFRDAILVGVNFSNAKTGLQRRWAITLVTIALLLSALSGFLSAIGGSLLGFLLANGDRENIYVSVVSLIILLIFFLITLRRGVSAACGFLIMAVTWAGLAAIVWAGMVAVAWVRTGTETGVMELAALVAVVTTATVSVILAAIGVVVIAGSAAVSGTVTGLLAVTVTVSVAGAVAGAVMVLAVKMGGLLVGALSVTVAILTILLSTDISCRALFEDKRQTWIRNLAMGLVARYGTNFQGSNLTDADFTQASLKNASFVKSNLTRTCWFQSKQLNRADVRTTYLEHQDIQQLLVTKNLQNRNLDGWDLQGMNLQGANFRDASLVAAKLNESNLQYADFSRANLIKTQFHKADLRGATLTGAYIGDWGVTPETKLYGVKCEYIFRRIPTKDNPNPYRLPTNWDVTFQDGEFTQLMSPVSKLSKI
ncbi:MAG: pentapeptide repeat-containing protein [Scytonema sp. PMC 1069.18]|nr:pentapeptide repeat-containing protein [Scytonema sp. PMC 1069.18]MEC4886172.1 pentapeptide repeat-containing protein [Scytonema sp. PMC 1070.18]